MINFAKYFIVPALYFFLYCLIPSVIYIFSLAAYLILVIATNHFFPPLSSKYIAVFSNMIIVTTLFFSFLFVFRISVAYKKYKKEIDNKWLSFWMQSPKNIISYLDISWKFADLEK